MIIPNFITGSGPLFKEKIYVTSPNLPPWEELAPMISGMLESKWLTNFGALHNRFSDELKEVLGVKYALPCCNATIALFVLLKALGLKGEVITTPFTFPATIHAITMAGLTPRFCDIDPDGYTLDPDKVKEALSPSVSAILAVNVFCNITDVDKLEELAAKRGIPVVYDSAHSFLSVYNNKPVGGFGKAEVFSFHATKLFTTLEGGLITTNDESLYKKLRLFINFGIQDEEHVVEAGLNGKMPEINAIFGLLSLRMRQRVLGNLAKLTALYKENLASVPGIKFQEVRQGYKPNCQYMAVEIIKEQFGMDRDLLHKVLAADNVVARKYFFPSANNYECYRNEDFSRLFKGPNVDILSSRVLCLPLYAGLDPETALKICGLLKSAHEHCEEIVGSVS